MNFKEETLRACKGKTIGWGMYYSVNNHCEYDPDTETLIEVRPPHPEKVLPPNHTQKELERFLDSMDFEYDNSFGLQEIGGKIVFTDGSWLTREEYDGSEWWQLHQCPEYESTILMLNCS